LICDGNYVTFIRTAAAGAVALRHLARPDSEVAVVVGAGVQGHGQVLALASVLQRLRVIRCFDVDAERLSAFVNVVTPLVRPRVEAADSLDRAVRDADVVVTCTPARQPFLRSAWIRPGTHISAMGADTKGKHEVESALLTHATLVVDDVAQATELGESQHLRSMDGPTQDRIHATLGEVTAGRKVGRTRRDEITLFDATGIALQDLAVAGVALERAIADGLGYRMDLAS
jgi:ornithine cyclodeaminase